MKIAFFVPNLNLKNINFCFPEYGNPGSGASEYINVALPFYLSNDQYEMSIYAQDISKMPKGIDCIKCNSIKEAAINAKANGIDIFIFRTRINEEDLILDLLEDLKLNSIGIAQLTPSLEHQRKIANCESFRALVAVGSVQYDYLCDSPLFKKLTYINNGISFDACSKFASEKNNKLVVYMGALVPQKGFHILARVWKDVLKIYPDAQLRVIGSSRIYNENYKTGPFEIADEDYEMNYIIPYLCDVNNKLHPSVKFLGSLGIEKYKHLSEALIGVANPSGDTETCCVSAVEMGACSTVVVSGAYNALLDTVINGKTGLLGRGDQELINNICYLLKNPNIAIKMGEYGRLNVESNFDFKVVIKNWYKLFDQINNGGVPIKPKHHFKNLIYQRKFLRMLNLFISIYLRKIMSWPSIQEVEEYLLKVINK